MDCCPQFWKCNWKISKCFFVLAQDYFPFIVNSPKKNPVQPKYLIRCSFLVSVEKNTVSRGGVEMGAEGRESWRFSLAYRLLSVLLGERWTGRNRADGLCWTRDARGETDGSGELPAYTKSELRSMALLFSLKGYKFPLHQTHSNLNIRNFPGGAVVKNPPSNAGDTGSSPGPGRSHMPRSN